MTFEQFKTAFHVDLNPQQEAAVRQDGGPVLLLAVPGSGKTTVLVSRLGYLIHCRGADPRRLLTVTYTVAATADMRRRFARRFGEACAEAVSFRTINGLCASIINRYAAVKGSTPFRLVSEGAEQGRILRTCYAALGAGYPSDAEVKEAQTKITYCKNTCAIAEEIGAVELEGVDFPALYRAYQDALRNHALMDYDDQMVIAYRILCKYPDLRAHFQGRWQDISVDEAQDTSKIQHLILRLLSAGHRSLFLVGDEDQSIYGFRAAWPQALLEFEQVYPEGRVLYLETNYRSTGAIVDRAGAFIARNAARRPKRMRAHGEAGEAVRYTVLPDCREQYEYLARLALRGEGQTAVLYRNNDSALPLMNLLECRGIPYFCRQRESLFFTHPVVRDLTEILRFAYAPDNRSLFLDIYFKLGLRMKKTAVSALLAGLRGGPVLRGLRESGRLVPWQAARVGRLEGQLARLPGLSSYEALRQIVDAMGYGDYLENRGGDRGKVDVLLALADQEEGIPEFLVRLEELRVLAGQGSGAADCPFVLSTIHASKGLEYDRVVLMDVVDGIFPALPPGQGVYARENRAVLEEERRLFYVGVTRARRQVELLGYAARFGVPTPDPAVFARELLELRAPPCPAPAAVQNPSQTAAERYQPGARVVHRAFGPGAVEDRVGNIVSIALDGGGVKRVDLGACLRKHLLRLEQTS